MYPRFYAAVICATLHAAAGAGSADDVKLVAADIRVTLEGDVVRVDDAYTLDLSGVRSDVIVRHPATKSASYVEMGGFRPDDTLIVADIKKDYGVTFEKPVSETRTAVPAAAGPARPWTDFRASVNGTPVAAALVERYEIAPAGSEDHGGPTSVLESTRYVEWTLPAAVDKAEVKLSYSGEYETYGLWYLRYATIKVYGVPGWAGPLATGSIVVEFGPDLGYPITFRGDALPPAEVNATASATTITWDISAADPNQRPAVVICMPFESEIGEGPRAGALELAGLDAEHAGYPARVDADNLNFRTQPSADAPRAARPTLAKDEYVYVFESRGEWYRAETADGAEGWVRWRYVDPDTHVENIYVKLDYDAGA